MRPSARLLALAVATLASLAVLLPVGSASAQAPSVCPATFQVLHYDSVGNLRLQAGAYQVTVYGGLTCAASTDLLHNFLEDFDGALPRPWRLNVGTATFTRGSGPIGFSLARAQTPSGGGGGRYPATGNLCPATFRVLHNDRVGSLRLPAGSYTVTLLSTHNLTCTRASRLFAQFLEDFDGMLPGLWTVDPQTGTFRRGAANYGFRVKPTSASNTGGGGSGVHPRRGQFCPGTFQVLNNTRIGRLRVAKGRYWIVMLSGQGLTCAQASSQFTRFLDEDFDGMLPSPWRLDASTATFTRGAGSSVGFRVKPVRG